jgi:hypothetical protein
MDKQRSISYNIASKVRNWTYDAEQTSPSIFRFKIKLFSENKNSWVTVNHVTRAEPQVRSSMNGVVEIGEPVREDYEPTTKQNYNNINFSSVSGVRYYKIPAKKVEVPEIKEEFDVEHIDFFREFDYNSESHIAFHRLVLYYENTKLWAGSTSIK